MIGCFYDGELMARSAPAKILARMLREYTRTERDTFTNWEFINDPNIVPDPTFHNVPVRMKRVIETVATKSDCIRLRRTGKGKVRLEKLRPFEYREV
jgi:hypothetical protein